jgi:hypothetical protein
MVRHEDLLGGWGLGVVAASCTADLGEETWAGLRLVLCPSILAVKIDPMYYF